MVSAPFGFTWSQTKGELEALGIEMTCEIFPDTGINSCTTNSSPKRFSQAEKFYLYLVPGKGLQKVMMIGETIEGDSTGSEGKSRYGKLKSALAKKYGEPENYERTGLKLYDERDEFYQCLEYDGCGMYASYWSNDQLLGAISVQINGLRRGEGWISLTYESKDWGNLLNEIKSKTAAEDEALL
tara:strand:- start:1797 stop:2348 length:552 start_codon:yes stop_codon:yes gene_type:complete